MRQETSQQAIQKWLLTSTKTLSSVNSKFLNNSESQAREA